MTAMLIPLTEFSVGNPWWLNGLMVLGCVMLCMLCRPVEPPKWLEWMQLVGRGLLLGAFLHSASYFWPGEKAEYVVPLAILLFAEQAAERGEKTAARSVNILRYGVLAVLGIVLFSAIPEIDWGNQEEAKPNFTLLPVLLLPMIGRRKLQAGQGIAILCAVVVSGWVIGNVTGPQGNLYELSRSISILGTAQRFESVTAVAMTIGYFGLGTFLLRSGEGKERQKTNARLCSLIAAVWYLTGIQIHGIILAGMMLLLWGLLPLLG